jgi:flagellar basal-body rod protein FlgG
LNVDASGNVAGGEQLAGQISLVRFDDPQKQVLKRGDNAWRLKDGATEPGGNPLDNGAASLLPGTYERSNAGAVESLVELIQNLRHYEAAQKVIQSEDTALNIAASQLARQPQQ